MSNEAKGPVVVPIDKELLGAAIDLFGELPTGTIPMKIVGMMVSKLQNIYSQPGQEIDLEPRRPATAPPQLVPTPEELAAAAEADGPKNGAPKA